MASTSKILKTLENRGVSLTSHEVNISILYSTVDSIYYRRDNGRITNVEATAAIEAAIARYREYENPETNNDDDIL